MLHQMLQVPQRSMEIKTCAFFVYKTCGAVRFYNIQTFLDTNW